MSKVLILICKKSKNLIEREFEGFAQNKNQKLKRWGGLWGVFIEVDLFKVDTISLTTMFIGKGVVD